MREEYPVMISLAVSLILIALSLVGWWLRGS
jgi:hypothetical protein